MHLPAISQQLLVKCHTMTIRSSGPPFTCSIGWESFLSCTVLEDRRKCFDSFGSNFVAYPQSDDCVLSLDLRVLNVVLPKFSMCQSYDSVMLDIFEVNGYLEVSSAYRVAQKERGT